MLAGAARGGTGSKGGRGPVRLSDEKAQKYKYHQNRKGKIQKYEYHQNGKVQKYGYHHNRKGKAEKYGYHQNRKGILQKYGTPKQAWKEIILNN